MFEAIVIFIIIIGLLIAFNQRGKAFGVFIVGMIIWLLIRNIGSILPF